MVTINYITASGTRKCKSVRKDNLTPWVLTLEQKGCTVLEHGTKEVCNES